MGGGSLLREYAHVVCIMHSIFASYYSYSFTNGLHTWYFAHINGAWHKHRLHVRVHGIGRMVHGLMGAHLSYFN